MEGQKTYQEYIVELRNDKKFDEMIKNMIAGWARESILGKDFCKDSCQDRCGTLLCDKHCQ